MKRFILSLFFILLVCTNSFAQAQKNTVYVSVNGLVCDFCATSLEKVFGKQKAVESIKVNLSAKVVTIHFKKGYHLNDATIRKLIEDSGYNVREIRHEK